MAFTGQTKIIKKGKPQTSLEVNVARHVFDLQTNSEPDFAKLLKELYIVGAKELDLGEKRAIVVFVPYPKLKQFQLVHSKLVEELEKKFSGKDVVILAQRTILNRITKKNRTQRQKRPQSRSLTAVHNAILEDLVYPTQIVDKRMRVRLDGSRLFKVSLDPKKRQLVERKLDTISALYKRLCGKDVVFSFPHHLERPVTKEEENQ